MTWGHQQPKSKTAWISGHGWYLLMYAQSVFRGYNLENLDILGGLNEDGLENSVLLNSSYSKGQRSTLYYSSHTELANDVTVIGTKGIIRIPEMMHCPTKVITGNQEFDFPLPAPQMGTNYWNAPGFKYECDHVKHCIEKGLLESPLMPHKDTLDIMDLCDRIRTTLGINYAED